MIKIGKKLKKGIKDRFLIKIEFCELPGEKVIVCHKREIKNILNALYNFRNAVTLAEVRPFMKTGTWPEYVSYLDNGMGVLAYCRVKHFSAVYIDKKGDLYEVDLNEGDYLEGCE